ncbi:RNA-directed DNA polymerase, eukaryota, reverse transcriptase zinc-binding domain protein [Tanacetum coccineum]
MSAKRNRSKRKICISNKYENTICDLNKNKEVRSEESEEHLEIGVLDTDLGDEEVIGAHEVSENAGEGLVLEMDDGADGTTNENGDNNCTCKDSDDSPVEISCTNEATQELSNVSDKVKMTYAKMIGSKNIKLDKKMCYVLTVVCENSFDVVIFDEELVNTGSVKWNLSVSEYFVGMKMNFDELRPLLAQKGNPDISFEKAEPEKVPLWIKIMSGYARVLVEVSACKEFVEVQYKDDKSVIVRTKKIKVEYSWKHAKCNHCNVFRNNFTMCKARPKTMKEMAKLQEEKEKNKVLADNFIPVRNQGAKIQFNDGRMYNIDMRRYDNGHEWNRNEKRNNKQEYRPKADSKNSVQPDVIKEKNVEKSASGVANKETFTQDTRRRSKQFAILKDLEGNNGDEIDYELKKEVDYFITQKLQPTPCETNKWSHKMVNYFKDRWEERNPQQEISGEEEVMKDTGKIGRTMYVNESVGEVTEVVAQAKDLNRVCSKIFVEVPSMSWQVMFCLVEIIHQKIKFFCSTVYAANHGKERQSLWNDLIIQKSFSDGLPWVLMGDFNVTLSPQDHSMDGLSVSKDMHDFHDCVNLIEVEDICSLGFYYTWTKSPQNPFVGTLKKLDRVMANEKFLNSFLKAHVIFLPYIISDHCPAIEVMPNSLDRKPKPFRFANYIADKPEFLQKVNDNWQEEVSGFKTFQAVKKLKRLKKTLNNQLKEC